MDFEKELNELDDELRLFTHERDAAKCILRRLRISRLVCHSAFGAGVSDEVVATVMAAISAEASFIAASEVMIEAEAAG